MFACSQDPESFGGEDVGHPRLPLSDSAESYLHLPRWVEEAPQGGDSWLPARVYRSPELLCSTFSSEMPSIVSRCVTLPVSGAVV